MQHFIKIYLPIYVAVYLLIAFVIPTYRTWKKTGINPITFSNKNDAHDYIGLVMKIIIAILFATTIIYTLGYPFYKYLNPIAALQNTIVQLMGLIIIHISLIWISIALYQMSNSWRIGIDTVNKTELVTKGVFKFSRNPIFLGIILSILGIFLIIPNAVNLSITVLSYFIIQVQIRLEEAFLFDQHGATYYKYCATTRRLI